MYRKLGLIAAAIAAFAIFAGIASAGWADGRNGGPSSVSPLSVGERFKTCLITEMQSLTGGTSNQLPIIPDYSVALKYRVPEAPLVLAETEYEKCDAKCETEFRECYRKARGTEENQKCVDAWRECQWGCK